MNEKEIKRIRQEMQWLFEERASLLRQIGAGKQGFNFPYQAGRRTLTEARTRAVEDNNGLYHLAMDMLNMGQNTTMHSFKFYEWKL